MQMTSGAERGFEAGALTVDGSEALSSFSWWHGLPEAQTKQFFAPLTLDLCGHIIADLCNRYVGPMGKPEKIQRDCDGASGWRVHLTDAHEALRLMYWQSGRKIEFANVGPKMELEICEGYEGGAQQTAVTSLGNPKVLGQFPSLNW